MFVSTTTAVLGLLGYSSYSPGKAALRCACPHLADEFLVIVLIGALALADTLKSEFILYDGIDVQIYYPGTILTPGFEEEMKTKPEILKKIEESDIVVDAPKAAAILFRGKGLALTPSLSYKLMLTLVHCRRAAR